MMSSGRRQQPNRAQLYLAPTIFTYFIKKIPDDRPNILVYQILILNTYLPLFLFIQI